MSSSNRIADGGPTWGDIDVSSTAVCVLTRFGLRRPWHLVSTYVAYRWLLRELGRRMPDGLLQARFLVENATTCYSLSLWADETAISHFGTLSREHVAVANRVLGRLRRSGGRPEIWSTKWQLLRISDNLTWDGFDLRSAIATREREDV